MMRKKLERIPCAVCNEYLAASKKKMKRISKRTVTHFLSRDYRRLTDGQRICQADVALSLRDSSAAEMNQN